MYTPYVIAFVFLLGAFFDLLKYHFLVSDNNDFIAFMVFLVMALNLLETYRLRETEEKKEK